MYVHGITFAAAPQAESDCPWCRLRLRHRSSFYAHLVNSYCSREFARKERYLISVPIFSMLRSRVPKLARARNLPSPQTSLLPSPQTKHKRGDNCQAQPHTASDSCNSPYISFTSLSSLALQPQLRPSASNYTSTSQFATSTALHHAEQEPQADCAVPAI